MASTRNGALPKGVSFRNDGFVGRVMIEGARVLSPRYLTASEAAAWVHRMKAGSRRSRAEFFSLQDAIDLLMADLGHKGARNGTVRFYRQQTSALLEAWPAETPLIRIDAKAIQRFLELRGEEAGSSSAVKSHTTLRRLWRLAARKSEQTGIVDDPMPKVTAPRHEAERFEALHGDAVDEILTAIDAAGAPLDAALIEILFTTGLRRAEAGRVRLDDVRGDSLLVRGKTGHAKLPLSRTAQLALGLWIDDARKKKRDHVLPGINEDARAWGVTRICQRWQEELEQPLLHPHALRHGFCTELVRSGVSIEEAHILMRHSTMDQTMRYFHEDGESVRSAMGVFDRRRRRGMRFLEGGRGEVGS